MGILVWQDFMFACSMYPGDAPFIENVRQEAIENVRRLRNHPSLALWAGNNEIEAAWKGWGWQEKFHLSKAAQDKIWRAYKRVFSEVLPKVVAEEDPGRFYTRSSPSANDDKIEANKGRLRRRMHYWGVWHAGGAVHRLRSEHVALHERVRLSVVPGVAERRPLRDAGRLRHRVAGHAVTPAPAPRAATLSCGRTCQTAIFASRRTSRRFFT